MIRGQLVTFDSAFRGRMALTITHVLLEGASATLCGRKKWAQSEGPITDPGDPTHAGGEPDCIRCSRALAKLRRS